MTTFYDALLATVTGLQERAQYRDTIKQADKAKRSYDIKPPNTGTGGNQEPQATPVPYDPNVGLTGGGEQGEPNIYDQIGVPTDEFGEPVPQWVYNLMNPEDAMPTVRPQMSGYDIVDVPGLAGGIMRPDPPVAADSEEAFNAYLSGGLSPYDSFIAKEVFGSLPGSNGGGDPYGAMYAKLALDQFEEQKRQARIANLFEIVGLEQQRQAENAAMAQNSAQLRASIAPMLAGNRQWYGGMEPYGAYSSVANFAGVPFTPPPLQTTNVNTGYVPMGESPYEAAIRQAVGV